MEKRNYINCTDLNQRILAKNLLALQAINESLTADLKTARTHNKLRLFFDGESFLNAEYYINRIFIPFYIKSPELEIPEHYNKWLRLKEPVVLIGAELGYGLKYLLDHSDIPRIYLYERDKYLMKIALTLHDFSESITTGRLIIVPHEDILTLKDRYVKKILPTPILFRENKVEYLTLSRIIKTGKISPNRAVIYSGTLFILDCAATLFDKGWDVFEIDSEITDSQTIRNLLDVLDPELILRINLLPAIERHSRNRFIVEWEIDPVAFPIPAVKRQNAQNLFVFTHNPERIPKFKQAGYSHFEYLPLCANPQKFYPRKLDENARKRFDCEVSFGGSLLFQSQLSFINKLLNLLKKLLQADRENWSRLYDWTTKLISNPPELTKKMKLVSELKDLLQNIKLPGQIHEEKFNFLVISSVEEYLAYLWRKQVVKALVPEGIQIWGTEEWKNDFAQNYRGKADHYLDLPQLYLASRINLDISRFYQPNIITMRVFDVLACGGFVLADRNEALLELFTENRDIVCYDSPEEAVDKVRYYLKHESERKAIAYRGYEKVVRSHTFENRINDILNKTGLIRRKDTLAKQEVEVSTTT